MREPEEGMSGIRAIAFLVVSTTLLMTLAGVTTPVAGAPALASGSGAGHKVAETAAGGGLTDQLRAAMTESTRTRSSNDAGVIAHQSGCSNALRNGDFELGDNGDWTGDVGAVITQNKPHFGDWGTWFGGVDDAGEAIVTSYSIPHHDPGALQSATLRFRWYMESSEGTSGVFDAFAITANDVADTELDRLEILAQVDNTTTPRDQWRDASVDLTAHFARRPNWSNTEIGLVDITDSSLPTSWYVDDVVLEICASGAAPSPTSTVTRAPVPSQTPRPTGQPTVRPTDPGPEEGPAIFLPFLIEGRIPGSRRGEPTAVPPTSEPVPTSPSPGCTDVLRNGDFELGENADWEGDVVGVISQEKPHFGEWGAWFGGVNNAEEVIVTTYTVPHIAGADLASATLRFKWQMESEEGTGSAYDGFGIVSNDESDSNGDRNELLVQIDNTTAPRNEWVEYVGDVTAHFTSRSGWTNSYLALVDVTDASQITSWYVDDVRLEMCTRADLPTRYRSPAGSVRLSSSILDLRDRLAHTEE